MFACLIDIGNTSMKIGIATHNASLSQPLKIGIATHNASLSQPLKIGNATHNASSASSLVTYNIPTNTGHSPDSLGLCLQQVLSHAGTREVLDACFVSSVVPSLEPILRQAVKRFLGCTVQMVPTDYPVPLENKYAQAHEVGADRLVAAYAARMLFPESRSVISVDYGTATTFDCVTDNAYLGGLICPGVMSSLGALATRTARLPRIALGRDMSETMQTENTLTPFIGRDTATSLQYGFVYGFASMTEGLLTRLKESLEGSVAVVASGGFARDVASVTQCFDVVQPDLILEGLQRLWLASKK